MAGTQSTNKSHSRSKKGKDPLAMQTKFGIPDLYDQSVEVKSFTTATELDRATLKPGFTLLKWERPEPGSPLIPMSAEEVKAALTEDSNVFPRAVDFWLTEKGENDPKPLRLDLEGHTHSVATAYALVASGGVFSITSEYVLLRNPHVDEEGGRIWGYVYPEYNGGLVLNGQPIEPRNEVSPSGIIPILRDAMTGRFNLGREFVQGWQYLTDTKAKAGVTQNMIDRAARWCDHSNKAVNKYWAVRHLLVENRSLRTFVWPKAWRYSAEVLRGLVAAPTTQGQAKLIREHITASREGNREYKERKENPTKNTEELAADQPIAKRLAEGNWSDEELDAIPVGSRVRIMISRTSSVDIPTNLYWLAGGKAGNKVVLSYFVGHPERALHIIK